MAMPNQPVSIGSGYRAIEWGGSHAASQSDIFGKSSVQPGTRPFMP